MENFKKAVSAKCAQHELEKDDLEPIGIMCDHPKEGMKTYHFMAKKDGKGVIKGSTVTYLEEDGK